MSLKTDWVAMQFIRYTNRVGLSTRTAIGEVGNKGLPEINLTVREVDYDNEKEVCRQYGVYGIHVILLFWKDRLIGRYYGKRTTDEFEAIFNNYSGIEGAVRESPEE